MGYTLLVYHKIPIPPGEGERFEIPIFLIINTFQAELSGRRRGASVKTPRHLEDVHDISCLQICP